MVRPVSDVVAEAAAKTRFVSFSEEIVSFVGGGVEFGAVVKVAVGDVTEPAWLLAASWKYSGPGEVARRSGGAGNRVEFGLVMACASRVIGDFEFTFNVLGMMGEAGSDGLRLCAKRGTGKEHRKHNESLGTCHGILLKQMGALWAGWAFGQKRTTAV